MLPARDIPRFLRVCSPAFRRKYVFGSRWNAIRRRRTSPGAPPAHPRRVSNANPARRRPEVAVHLPGYRGASEFDLQLHSSVLSRSFRLKAELPTSRQTAAGFTLIELLTVITIIGILAAILIPTAGSARTSANRAKTRVQFSQWAAGFEVFRQEYGTYPQLSPNGAMKLVNPPGTSINPQQVHLFHDTLTGRRRDPAGTWPTTTAGTPPPPQAQNTRRIQFVSFTDSDFVTTGDVSAGYNPNNQLWLIRDAFHNTSIAVVADSNLDGVVNGRDTTGGFPGVLPVGLPNTIRPTTVVTTGQTGGIHAGVIFYCAPPGATTENDLIMSWR